MDVYKSAGWKCLGKKSYTQEEIALGQTDLDMILTEQSRSV